MKQVVMADPPKKRACSMANWIASINGRKCTKYDNNGRKQDGLEGVVTNCRVAVLQYFTQQPVDGCTQPHSFVNALPPSHELGPKQPAKITPNFELPNPHNLPPSSPTDSIANDTLSRSHNSKSQSTPQHTERPPYGGCPLSFARTREITTATQFCTGRI